MQKRFFATILFLFFSTNLFSAELDGRLLDNGIKEQGFSWGWFECCSGYAGSSCGRDIELNMNVMTNKVGENLDRLTKRWEELVANEKEMMKRHSLGGYDTIRKTALVSSNLLESKKANFYLEKQNKILELEFDILKEELEVINTINEINLALQKGE